MIAKKSSIMKKNTIAARVFIDAANEVEGRNMTERVVIKWQMVPKEIHSHGVTSPITRSFLQLECGKESIVDAWRKALAAAPTPPTVAEREAKNLFDISTQDLKLMVGEMTAQELRTVRAVLSGLKARAYRNATSAGDAHE